MTIDPAELSAQKLAIEAELRQRLERDRSEASLSSSPSGIAVMCLACHAVNGADARFCTGCGTKFNAIVVSPGARVMMKGASE